MRPLFIIAGAAVLAFTQPALAQHTSQPSGTQPNQQNSTNPAQLRQSIQHDLEQAGYTNVQIMPEAFLVHARDKQGHPVTMMIEPGTVAAVTDLGPNGGTRGTSPSHPSSGSAPSKYSAHRPGSPPVGLGHLPAPTLDSKRLTISGSRGGAKAPCKSNTGTPSRGLSAECGTTPAPLGSA